MSTAFPPLIVIAGATATGKTRLSLALAAHIGSAEIISADSRQVYRGMDIGTAKVTAAERAAVVHHGLDLVDPDELFTAADYVRHARAALASIAARDGVAILVGGTGLYLRAVGRGLPLDDSGHDPEIRARLEARLAAEGISTLAAELLARAPDVAATTDLANPRRVVRALERLAVRGDAAPPAPVGYPGPCLWLGLEASGEEHRRWIEQRAAAQFRDGLLDEAATLLGRYPPDLRAFSAVGYREAFAVLRGESDVAGAVDRAAARTRQYARRQRTWFRRESIDAWLTAGEGAVANALPLVDQLLSGARQPPAAPATDLTLRRARLSPVRRLQGRTAERP